MPETLQCSECGKLFELEEIQSDPVLCTRCLIDRLEKESPLALALAGSVMKCLGVSNPELDAASQRALIDYVYEKGQAIQEQGKPQTRTQARIQKQKEKLKAQAKKQKHSYLKGLAGLCDCAICTAKALSQNAVYGKTAQSFKETDYRSAYPESLKEAFSGSKEGLGGTETAGADRADKEAGEGGAEGGSDKEAKGVRKAGGASGNRQGD